MNSAAAIVVSSAPRLLVRGCNPNKIRSVGISCRVHGRDLSSAGRSRQCPNTSTCASAKSQQAAKPAHAHTIHNRRGLGRANAKQRRYESTDKKAGTTADSTAAEAKAKSTEEVIRQTEEALAKLKESRGANRAKAIEDAFQAAKEQAASEPAVNWTRLRTPVLFGAGLYLGLVLFGNHRDEQTGSEFLAELRASFEGGAKEKNDSRGDGSGDDARPKIESSGAEKSSGATSEYEKWKASREDKNE